MLVYYLEAPHGHLMGEAMGNPQARTKVKGNLFSFTMPWEDIERCCHLACVHANTTQKAELTKLQQELGVPHSEETLALLVNVHLVGGTKDLAQYITGLTLRVSVIQRLIDILRGSGYPGYETDGINSAARVAQRLDDRYRKVYGEASFTPAAVEQAVRVHEKTSLSLVQDKVATPAEGLQSIDGWQRATRPSHIVAERSVQSQSNINENYAAMFAKFGDVNITTGCTMINQYLAWYLGMAFPHTLPSAVGGYDVPNRPRWRRPEDADIPYPRACLDVWTTPVDSGAGSSFQAPGLDLCNSKHLSVGPACRVKLFDLVRGLPQRIEGQLLTLLAFRLAFLSLEIAHADKRKALRPSDSHLQLQVLGWRVP